MVPLTDGSPGYHWNDVVQLFWSAQPTDYLGFPDLAFLAVHVGVRDHFSIVERFDHLVDERLDGGVGQQYCLRDLREAVEDGLLVDDEQLAVMRCPQRRQGLPTQPRATVEVAFRFDEVEGGEARSREKDDLAVWHPYGHDRCDNRARLVREAQGTTGRHIFRQERVVLPRIWAGLTYSPCHVMQS
jgi:hypothetical protein